MADERAIDDLVAEFFAAFDNRAGRTMDAARLRSLFLPGAIVVKRTGDTIEEMSVDAFITPRADLLASGRLTDFHEWETGARTQVTGGAASRVSRYSKEGMLDGAPYAGSGVKHTSFVRTATGWRIASLVWEDDA